MKLNIVALPYLDETVLSAIFGAALGEDPAQIADEPTRDFAEMILSLAGYNVKYRALQLKKLAPIFLAIFPDLEADPESMAVLLGAVLAIKELYGMRPDTLKAVLRHWSPAL